MMAADVMARVRRTGALGRLGEILAAEALAAKGFINVENLNEEIVHFPFADIVAERDNRRFLIGVKSRNEDRDVGSLNGAYNIVDIPRSEKRWMKEHGRSTDEVTALALSRAHELARSYGAEAAWITVPMRPLDGTYAVYFGRLRGHRPPEIYPNDVEGAGEIRAPRCGMDP